jgi:hypothetical protein
MNRNQNFENAKISDRPFGILDLLLIENFKGTMNVRTPCKARRNNFTGAWEVKYLN